MLRAAMAILLAAVIGNAKPAAKPLIPLQTGATWTYSGVVRWTVPNTNRVASAKIKWKTEIERVFVRGPRTVAVVKGLPFDLAWYEPQRSPRLSVIVVDAHALSIAEWSEDIVRRALAGEKVGGEVVRFPIRLGDCAGGDTPQRNDGRYCWHVEGHDGGVWQLVHRTGPDHQILELQPGAGIVAYQFEHHGTVASANVRLTQYRTK